MMTDPSKVVLELPEVPSTCTMDAGGSSHSVETAD